MNEEPLPLDDPSPLYNDALYNDIVPNEIGFTL
jgi:hypothetical protein